MTERLAREVASLGGENITQAITHALEERLERLKREKFPHDTLRAVMEISRRCSSLPDLDSRSPDQIMGYNSFGGLD